LPRDRVFLLLAALDSGGEELLERVAERLESLEGSIEAEDFDTVLGHVDPEVVEKRVLEKEDQSILEFQY